MPILKDLKDAIEFAKARNCDIAYIILTIEAEEELPPRINSTKVYGYPIVIEEMTNRWKLVLSNQWVTTDGSKRRTVTLPDILHQPSGQEVSTASMGTLSPMEASPMELVDRMAAGSYGRMVIMGMVGGLIRAPVLCESPLFTCALHGRASLRPACHGEPRTVSASHDTNTPKVEPVNKPLLSMSSHAIQSAYAATHTEEVDEHGR